MTATNAVATRVLRKSPALHQRQRTGMIKRLGTLHGLPQKVAQVLSIKEMATGGDFTPLAEQTCTPDPKQLKRRLAELLGEKTDRIETISPTGIQASIATVHKARLRNGHDVAIKILHPGITDNIDTDLQSLGLLCAPIGGLKKEFDHEAYKSELASMIGKETDLEAEARHIRCFERDLRNWHRWEAPHVYSALSGTEILTMTWLNGGSIEDAKNWPQAQRNTTAQELTRCYLQQLLHWRRLHADPHSGNLRFRLDDDMQPVIGLIDYGCVAHLNRDFSNGVRSLLKAGLRKETCAETLSTAFEEMGFDSQLLHPMKGLLPELVQSVLSPLLQPNSFVDEWNYNQRIKSVLSQWRMNFRLAGPASLIWFLRSWTGLMQYHRALRPSLDWSALLEEYSQPPTKEDPSNTVSMTTAHTTPMPAMQSDTLHIQVIDSGETKVRMAFGAAAAANLEVLVPMDLKDRLQERSINLSRIAEQTVQNDYQPGELFSLTDGPKNVRVWLE